MNCVAQDTYYAGHIKGVGHIYQQTVIDTYSKIEFAKLYDRKNALVTADIDAWILLLKNSHANFYRRNCRGKDDDKISFGFEDEESCVTSQRTSDSFGVRMVGDYEPHSGLAPPSYLSCTAHIQRRGFQKKLPLLFFSFFATPCPKPLPNTICAFNEHLMCNCQKIYLNCIQLLD